MRKNNLFKKAIAVIAAACTLVSATGFNGTTVKAANFAPVGVNQNLTGIISKINDESTVDYYTFITDETDSYYRINFKAYDGEARVCYEVYADPEMTESVIERDLCNGENRTDDLVKNLQPMKQYYMKVYGEDIGTSTIGYTINVEKYSTDDHSDNRTDLTGFKVGKTQTGVMNHNEDVDYYTFTTDDSNAFYYLQVKATSEGDAWTDVYFDIYSDAEMTANVVGRQVATGTTEKYDLEKMINPSTQYYVKVSSRDVLGMNQANYEFSIIKVADDVKDTSVEAKVIKLNQSYQQTIENSTDIDCYKITTSNYTDYKIALKTTAMNSNVELKIFKDKDLTQEIRCVECYDKNTLTSNNAIKLTPYRTYYVTVTGNENSKYTIGINAAAPANNKAKAQTVKKTRQVTISWSKVNKATGYEVYRAVKNGSYKKVATIKSAKTVKWIDKKVKKGYTYKYKVRAYAKVKGKTYYSAYSAEKAVKVK